MSRVQAGPGGDALRRAAKDGIPQAVERAREARLRIAHPAPECEQDQWDGTLPAINRAGMAAIVFVGWVSKPIEWFYGLRDRLELWSGPFYPAVRQVLITVSLVAAAIVVAAISYRVMFGQG